MSLPLVMTAAGAQPENPATIRANIVNDVAATNPGYTANLPGSMIEDIVSTDVAAVALCDAAQVEAVNNISPNSANAFVLSQLGALYGVPLGVGSNTSVPVVFAGTVGFVIAVGFTVSDGTHQYVVQDGGIIPTGGVSTPLFCIATQSGTWAVPANTVNQKITSVPSTVTLSVNNLTDGTPSTGPQTEEQYRAQVVQAGLATAQGYPDFLRTLLGKVTGVQPREVSIRQKSQSYEIIVGGGDPYEVANAIFMATFDLTSLTGSTLNVIAITQSNPGIVVTDLTHGYASGQVIQMNGVVGMVAVNGVNYTATVLDAHTFSIGVDTTGFAAYVSGGVVTPNLRNQIISILDYPDTYAIPFVTPLQQTVTMLIQWNTLATNLVSPTAVAALGVPAIVAYINAIYAGQPINVYELQTTFQQAVASLIVPGLLTRLIFTIAINGVPVPPDAGTGIIETDPESFVFTDAASIIVVRG